MTTDAAINQALALGFAWLGVQLVLSFAFLGLAADSMTKPNYKRDVP